MKDLLDTEDTCNDCYYFLQSGEIEGEEESDQSYSHHCLRYPPVFIGFTNCKEQCSKKFNCPCFQSFSTIQIDGGVICGEFKPKRA